MSRITAPVSKITRSLSSASTITIPSVRASSSLLEGGTVHHGAQLMPKYAELLHGRSSEQSESSRGITTTHRPTPQPSLANRSKPLMQSFSTATTFSTPSHHLDATLIPDLSYNINQAADSALQQRGDLPIRMPLLPDCSTTTYEPFTTAESAVNTPEVNIVAADPDKVAPAGALSEVSGIGLDGVDVKFVHGEGRWGQPSNGEEEREGGGMLRDIWKGMVDDVLGAPKAKAT